MRLRVSVMIPAVVLLGGSSIYAARSWMQREVALRVEAERQHYAAVARPAEPTGRFATIVVAAKPLSAGAELSRRELVCRHPLRAAKLITPTKINYCTKTVLRRPISSNVS